MVLATVGRTVAEATLVVHRRRRVGILPAHGHAEQSARHMFRGTDMCDALRPSNIARTTAALRPSNIARTTAAKLLWDL